jgi:hypothetical protein
MKNIIKKIGDRYYTMCFFLGYAVYALLDPGKAMFHMCGTLNTMCRIATAQLAEEKRKADLRKVMR